MATGSAHRQTLPPHLDWDTCDRARLARARAFDGLFFSGVRSTRIYCRPVCPVRCRRARRISPMPALPAGNRAGIAGLDGNGHHRRARDAPDQ
jgi:AraC family transcriptional regulator of adaptative response / DNA-3-methyladenine glycosylase II